MPASRTYIVERVEHTTVTAPSPEEAIARLSMTTDEEMFGNRAVIQTLARTVKLSAKEFV